MSKINLDEWGNIGEKTRGSKQEINFTGKKMDPATGLYYFNQRYYDPEIGRFLTEDPANQAFNPYLYCGNNPLMYTDPDGEWFWALVAVMFQSAVTSGLTSAVYQQITTGRINTQSVLNAMGSGALSGGLMNAVGGMFPGNPPLMSGAGVGKTLAHGVVGGITNSVGGGNFWNGFGVGAFSQATSGMVDKLDASNTGFSFTRVAAAAGVGGTASMIGGGSFLDGAKIGAFQRAFNHEMHAGKDARMDPGQIENPSWIKRTEDALSKVNKVIKENDGYWKGSLTVSSWALRKMSGINIPVRIVNEIFVHPSELY